jgi:RNA polymerase sigma factor for flagellar operon FliA
MDFPALAAKKRSAVECMALELSRGYGGAALKDELVQAGLVGLWQATQRYDDQVESTFWTFARQRVLGAMLDELRSLSHRSRTAHDAVVADTWAEKSPWALVFSVQLDDARDAPDAGATPDEVLATRERAAHVRRLLYRLPRLQAYVLRRHYLEDVNLKDVGLELGVTESRACQLAKTGLASSLSALTETEKSLLASGQLTPREKRTTKRLPPRRYEHDGKFLTLTGWSRELGVRVTTLANRIRRGWPVEKILGDPVRKRRKPATTDSARSCRPEPPPCSPS